MLDSNSGYQKFLQLLRQLIRANDQAAEAQLVRWLCRRGIAGEVGLVRGGKELLLDARDSGVALLKQLDLASTHLDLVDGSPGRQGGAPRGSVRTATGERPGCLRGGGACHRRSWW